MDAKEWRVLQVPEDAADGCTLAAPVPPSPWYCYSEECGRTLNRPKDLNCQFCGRHREECEG